MGCTSKEHQQKLLNIKLKNAITEVKILLVDFNKFDQVKEAINSKRKREMI